MAIINYDKSLFNQQEYYPLLHSYVDNPDNAEICFNLGYYYHSIGQTASAVGFYLRTAERSDDTLLQYEALIQASMCFDSQGCRNHTVEGILQHAVALEPNRPEGYYFLSRFYEKTEQWFDSYLIASIGLKVEEPGIPLRRNTDYPGNYGNLFQKAVSAYWVGLSEESSNIFKDLVGNYNLDKGHHSACIKNLNFFKLFDKTKPVYTRDVYNSLKFKFSDSDKIERNYSETFQDMFALSMLKGKKNGTYVQIGSGVPFESNNTALLEKNYDWKGISIHCSPDYVMQFREERNNPVEVKDALEVNYVKLLEYYDLPKEIDYLSLDTEPAARTYEILTKIPFDELKFAVITFRHGHFVDIDKTVREKSRKLLTDKGYKLVIGNVSPDDWKAHEDWYVHPDLVEDYVINAFENAKEELIQVDKVFFKNNKKKNYWKQTNYPTLEFTTSIPKDGCIVDCVFCPQRVLTEIYSDTKRLTLENFKKILAGIPSEVRIAFSGFTEPFLNKECADMILHAHEKGHRITVYTTGVGLGVEDLKKIQHIPFDDGPNGSFVLHLPDQENYAKHPRSKKYTELMEYLSKMFWEIKNFKVMCMGTLREDILQYFAQPKVEFQMYDRAGNLSREAILKPELLEVKDLYMTTPKSNESMTCFCQERLYHNVVLPNGNVVLCCMDYSLEGILGNLYEQDYDDIMPKPYSTFDLCRSCENRISPQELIQIEESFSLPIYEQS